MIKKSQSNLTKATDQTITAGTEAMEATAVTVETEAVITQEMKAITQFHPDMMRETDIGSMKKLQSGILTKTTCDIQTLIKY